MIDTPSAAEVATWPAPNYVNPVTRRPMLLAVEITFMILVTLFISIRFYSKIFIIKFLGTDDFVMLIAALASIATSIMMCISTGPAYQTGYHIWDIRPDLALNTAPIGKIGMASQLCYTFITFLLKTSVLLTYLRIFPSKLNKHFCYGMLLYMFAWGISSFCLALFQCTPIEAYWLPFNYPTTKCLDAKVIVWATGVPNIVSDFTIFLWPAKDLSKLQMSFKQRFTLIVMFGVGSCICVAGVCRLWFTSIYVSSIDLLWNGAVLYAIITIETSLGIICGCIPSCKPLLSRAFPRVFNSTGNRSAGTKSKASSTAYPPGSKGFTSLSDGSIVKSQEYSVEYGSPKESAFGGKVNYLNKPRTGGPGVVVPKRPLKRDPDAISEDSAEWIIMPDRTLSRQQVGIRQEV